MLSIAILLDMLQGMSLLEEDELGRKFLFVYVGQAKVVFVNEESTAFMIGSAPTFSPSLQVRNRLRRNHDSSSSLFGHLTNTDSHSLELHVSFVLIKAV